jgi:hypothetical protein
MENIVVCPESVAAFRELMTNPGKHGLSFPSLDNCFIASDTPTAKHILFKQYVDLINKPLPKIFFYIVMDEVFPKIGIDPTNNCAGYYLKVKNQST